jgi:hypothetical protein
MVPETDAFSCGLAWTNNKTRSNEMRAITEF